MAIIWKGVNINKRYYHSRFPDDYYTPLMFAAENGRTGCTDHLLFYGADPHARNSKGKTALHIAAKNGHISCVKSLIAFGSNVNLGKSSWWFGFQYGSACTPLHEAAKAGHYGVLDYLMQNGAHVNALDDYRLTPLHWACMKDRYDCAELLLQNGAEINLKAPFVGFINFGPGTFTTTDKNEPLTQTALHMVARLGNACLVDMLVDNGAHVCEKDVNGDTPLNCAIKDLESMLTPIESWVARYVSQQHLYCEDEERIRKQKTTIQALLELNMDFAVQNTNLAETVKKNGMLLPCELENEFKSLEEDWCRLNVVPIYLLFDSQSKRRVAFKLVCMECEQMGWVNEGRPYLNMAIFSITNTNSGRLVLTSISKGIPHLKIEIFQPKAVEFLDNIHSCLPGTLKSLLQKLKTPEIQGIHEIEPYFNPCYGSAQGYNNCYIPYSAIKSLESGKLKVGSCKDHYKNIYPQDIIPWFETPRGPQNRCDTNFPNFLGEKNPQKCMNRAARLITNETRLFDLGLKLGLSKGDVEIIRTDNPTSIVQAGFTMLMEWKNQTSCDLDTLKKELYDACVSCNIVGKVKDS